MDLAQPRLVCREEIFAARPERAAGIRFTGLWVAGSLAGLERQTVAIVGSRAPSDAGRGRAKALGRVLSEAGACVISGLALGIDAAAHTGAIDAKRATIAVLGGGHRAFYPPRNRPLAESMLAQGGAVLSPFEPDHPSFPGQFLERNAVVAALADLVVIVEAAARSGALNTARWATDLGIDVLAYPGDVDRTAAAGCNALIRDGATLVRGPEDVLEALGGTAYVRAPQLLDATARMRERYATDDRALAIIETLRHEAGSLEAIAASLALSAGQTMATLVRLEVDGAIERRDGSHYALVR